MATYDAHSALLVVDVQNDFADPSGTLFVRGAEEVIPVIGAEMAKAIAAGAIAVYTQDWHPEHTPHFRQDGGVWPVHCVHDSWGADFHPRLSVAGPVVRKGADGKDGYSGFSVRDPLSGETSTTELDNLLKAHQVQRLVIGGLATDYCVVETVVDARMLGYPVEVLAAGIRAVDMTPGDGDRAMARMRDAGADLV
jgi:nicotinamidase/pyrazinamidase